MTAEGVDRDGAARLQRSGLTSRASSASPSSSATVERLRRWPLRSPRGRPAGRLARRRAAADRRRSSIRRAPPRRSAAGRPPGRRAALRARRRLRRRRAARGAGPRTSPSATSTPAGAVAETSARGRAGPPARRRRPPPRRRVPARARRRRRRTCGRSRARRSSAPPGSRGPRPPPRPRRPSSPGRRRPPRSRTRRRAEAAVPPASAPAESGSRQIGAEARQRTASSVADRSPSRRRPWGAAALRSTSNRWAQREQAASSSPPARELRRGAAVGGGGVEGARHVAQARRRAWRWPGGPRARRGGTSRRRRTRERGRPRGRALRPPRRRRAPPGSRRRVGRIGTRAPDVERVDRLEARIEQSGEAPARRLGDLGEPEPDALGHVGHERALGAGVVHRSDAARGRRRCRPPSCRKSSSVSAISSRSCTLVAPQASNNASHAPSSPARAPECAGPWSGPSPSCRR